LCISFPVCLFHSFSSPPSVSMQHSCLPAAHERGWFPHAGKLVVGDVSAEAPNVAPSVVAASPLEIPSTKIQEPLEILRRGFRTPAWDPKAQTPDPLEILRRRFRTGLRS
jgi:hypothetical protein